MGSRIRLLGFLSAVIAYVVTLTVPLYSTASETSNADGSTTSTTGTATLIEVNGWDAAIPGLVLVLLALAVWLAGYVLIRWIALGIFLLLTALLLTSMGMFYLPAALLLMLGVSLDRGVEDGPA